MSRSGLRRFALIACFVSIGWACTLFNPLEEYGPGKKKAPDAAATVEAGPGADAAAELERWPEPPKTDDGTESLDLTFAASTLEMNPPSDKASGYDLDGVWTCPGPPSCARVGSLPTECDTKGGVDQAGTALIGSALAVGGRDKGANESIAKGFHTLLLTIQLYNGGQNDSQVVLALYTSNGTELDINGDNKPPLHDGTDVWTVDPASISGGGEKGPPYVPLMLDARAYVANGTVVARGDFTLDLADLKIKLTGAVLTAKVVRDGKAFRLEEGRLAGRWGTKDLLTALDTLKAPDSNEGLCGTNSFYRTLKSQICGAPDLNVDRLKDNTDAPCNALGMAVTFTAEPAIIGPVLGPGTIKHYCGDAWVDTCP